MLTHWYVSLECVCVCLVFINQTNVGGTSVWLLTWLSIQDICHFATDVYSSSPSTTWPGWQHLYFSHHSDETNSLFILPSLIWVSWHTFVSVRNSFILSLNESKSPWMKSRRSRWDVNRSDKVTTTECDATMLRCYSTLQHVNAWVWVLQRNHYQDDCDLHKMHEWQTVTVRPQSNLCIRVLQSVEQRRIKVVVW